MSWPSGSRIAFGSKKDRTEDTRESVGRKVEDQHLIQKDSTSDPFPSAFSPSNIGAPRVCDDSIWSKTISARLLKKQWPKLSFDCPQNVADRFRELANQDVKNRGGAVKVSGLAAISLWNSLPDPIRKGMIEWAKRAEDAVDHESNLPGSIEQPLAVFAAMLKTLIHDHATKKTDPEPGPTEPAWFVDRILDPAVMKAIKPPPETRSELMRHRTAGGKAG